MKRPPKEGSETENSLLMRRPEFTLRQLAQAAQAGRVTDSELARRTPMTTFPIDDLPPEQLSDRDDGIFIEVAKHGQGARVHITIADVAAHIPPGTPLAKAARKRAFTVYRDGGNSTMFPQALQDQLSLEDQQARLGLTVTIDLDANYQPIHTEFQRVVTDTHALSYAQAQKKMKKGDPQLQLMATIAKGVREQYFGHGYAALNEAGERKTQSPNASKDQLAATKLVELYMLLANNVTANFFQRAQIPFIYRNFDTSSTRAYYSTHVNGHSELEKHGLSGPYCHFTSPIRRGADFFDQHQAHFVIDVLEEAEAGLMAIASSLDRQQLRRLLWNNGHALLTHVAMNRADITPIQHSLAAILTELGHAPNDETTSAIKRLACALAAHIPPFSTAELEESATEISALHHAEQTESQRINKSDNALKLAHKRLDSIGDKPLRDIPADAFSKLLAAAAMTGYLPRPLLEETHRRLNGVNPYHRLDLVNDGLQVMILATYPNDRSWKSLKKAVARVIKQDPGTVNGILERAIRTPGALRGGALQTAEASLPVQNESMPMHNSHIRGALLTYRSTPGAPLMSAPYYSIGHDARAALSHANYSFLEHYAFGQLQPVDQIAIPNLLYADLDVSEKPRRSIVEEMVASIGAKLTITHEKTEPDCVAATLQLSGGALAAPITLISDAVNELEAEKSVLRKLLRHTMFQHATSFMTIGDTQRALNPQSLLRQLAEDVGATLSIATEEQAQKPRTPVQHQATIILTLPTSITGDQPVTLHYKAQGPNKDRAIRDAAHQALLALESSYGIAEKNSTAPLSIEQNVRSWVSAVTQPSTPRAVIIPYCSIFRRM